MLPTTVPIPKATIVRMAAPVAAPTAPNIVLPNADVVLWTSRCWKFFNLKSAWALSLLDV